MPPMVETHFRFWNEGRESFPVTGAAGFWARRVVREIEGRRVPSLCEADAFAYATWHVLRHAVHGNLRLYHVYELAHFLDRTAGDDAFWSECRDAEAAAMRLAWEWFRPRMNLIARERMQALPRAAARWFDVFAFSPALGVERPNKHELFLHLCLAQGWRNRMWIVARRLLPTNPPRVEKDPHVARAGPGMRLRRVAFLWFVYDTAIPAWNGPSSDFPNYYTAARLAIAREPLHLFYDWTWFQKRIDEAGFERQLGGYVPQTPVAMLPYIPLAGMSPLAARRVWVALNCVFLGGTLWMLAPITGLGIPELWLVAMAGYGTLRSNFALGQYYVFLLALLTAGVWLILRKREFAGGLLWGAALALKLYGGPLMVFALVKRRWRLAGGMFVVGAVALVGAVAWFGRRDLEYFATAVLPRALGGEIID